MKDEQTTTTYTDTYTTTSIIDSQWGADEALSLLGWEEDDDYDDSDDDEEEGEYE